MRKVLILITSLLVIITMTACTTNVPTNTNQANVADTSDKNNKFKKQEEQDKREAEELAKKEAEEKLKNEAMSAVEGFMDEFLVLNLKGMAEHTNANIDYSEMTYLSLDEYKREMLSEFTVFQSMGLPLEGFSSIVDKVFDSFEKYSSYQIINAEVQGENVAFDVNVKFIRAELMENIINDAVNKVNTEELEMKVAGALLVSGLSGKSLSSVIDATLVPIVEALDLSLIHIFSGNYQDMDAKNVLLTKKGVCEGYANLMAALLRSKGIPCKVQGGYALGIDTKKEWSSSNIDTTEGNHAWNEVYVNGRWIIIDATWDSQNQYKDGRYIIGETITQTYFDSTLEFFSLSHKLIDENVTIE